MYYVLIPCSSSLQVGPSRSVGTHDTGGGMAGTGEVGASSSLSSVSEEEQEEIRSLSNVSSKVCGAETKVLEAKWGRDGFITKKVLLQRASWPRAFLTH